MYACLACLVLFDARGGPPPPIETTVGAAALVCALLLALAYVPAVIHRPRLVDDLCADLLACGTHAAGIVVLVADPRLAYACLLHSAFFLAQNRALPRVPHGLAVVVHTTVGLAALACYLQGPRITDLRQFVISAVCPHGLEVAARVVGHAHALVVASS